VVEVAHEAGVDLYTNYDARQMAWTLHREGHRAFGSERWLQLLTSFNSLMRAKQRSGIKTSVDDFFNTLDQLRFKSRQRYVDEIINVMWQARGHAEGFQGSLAGGRSQAPALDPLFACLPQTARFWFKKVRQVIDVVHDEQAALTEERIKAMQLVLARLSRTHSGHVLLGQVHQVNSRADPRVQVADLLAGAAREIAAKELARSGDDELTNLLRPFVDPWSIWSDKRSWQALTGRPAPGS